MDNDTRYKTTRLYVPKESIEKYEQKAAWNGAKGIYPLYPTDSISLSKEVSVILAKPTKNRIYYKTDSRKPLSEG